MFFCFFVFLFCFLFFCFFLGGGFVCLFFLVFFFIFFLVLGFVFSDVLRWVKILLAYLWSWSLLFSAYPDTQCWLGMISHSPETGVL